MLNCYFLLGLRRLSFATLNENSHQGLVRLIRIECIRNIAFISSFRLQPNFMFDFSPFNNDSFQNLIFRVVLIAKHVQCIRFQYNYDKVYPKKVLGSSPIHVLVFSACTQFCALSNSFCLIHAYTQR